MFVQSQQNRPQTMLEKPPGGMALGRTDSATIYVRPAHGSPNRLMRQPIAQLTGKTILPERSPHKNAEHICGIFSARYAGGHSTTYRQ